MRYLIPALALLALSAAPVMAAGNDPVGQSLSNAIQDANKATQDADRAVLNVRMAAIVALQERDMLRELTDKQRERIAELERKCGDRCAAPQPQAQDKPAPNAGPAAKPAE